MLGPASAEPEAVMRHRHPERQPWAFAAVLQRIVISGLFFFFFFIFFTTASAYPDTPETSAFASSTSAAASASAASTQTLLAPSRRPSAPAPSDQLGHATPPSAADAASSTLVKIPLLARLDDSAASSSASALRLCAVSPPPSPTPRCARLVAPPPGRDAIMSDLGYRINNEYTCTTIGGETFCRVHVPVLKADAPMRATDMRVVLAVVSCLAGILAWGLV